MTSTSRTSPLATFILLLAATGGPIPKAQQTAAIDATPQPKTGIRFDFVRPGLPVPKFTLDLDETGAGTYIAEEASSQPVPEIHREFNLTAATTTKIFALARAAHLSQETCASKAKNIADTGKKVITLSAPGTSEACTYNYSESKDVQALTNLFFGIAQTMDMGRRLDFLHRFDRLGLNEAVESLNQEVTAGQALEIGTIAPSLRSIAADAEVMQRVRARATALLTLMPVNDPPR